MVRQGDADAMVAGCANPTRRVIEAGLMTVGLADRYRAAVELFSHGRAGFPERARAPLSLPIARSTPIPSPRELADIAIASARNARACLVKTPRVAMLSFSTKGSAQHARVDKVREALTLCAQREPALAIDGEFQADAALSPDSRAQESEGEKRGRRAGQCARSFPDLDSGNIGYKLTQWLGGAQAIGPFLQGFAKPVSDLSRGASVEDIVSTVAVVLAMAK